MIVPSSGPKDAKIAIVGEAPAATEVDQGKPFVGPSGQLLTRLLLQCGIVREQCYIANVVPERPPNDDMSHFIKISNKKATPTSDYLHWEQYLYDELTDLNPNIIILAGSYALYALTRKFTISNWRGSILQSVTGHKCIPTFHPASALPNRSFINQLLIINDLQRAKKESTSPEITRQKRFLGVHLSFKELINHLDTIHDVIPKVAVDIEVVGNELNCIAVAVGLDHSVCIPFIDKNGKSFWSEDEELEIMEHLAMILGSTDTVKIFQNAAFDMGFLYDRYGIETNNIEDTMVGQAILHPEYPKSLGFLTSLYCNGEPYYKDDGKIWKGERNPDEQFWNYNSMDSAVTFEVHTPIQEELKKMGNLETYQRQLTIIKPLIEMSNRGMRIDEDKLYQLQIDSQTQIDTSTTELHDLVGHELNPNSPKQLKEYFYDTKKAKPYYENRKVTTNEKAMTRLSIAGFKEAELILKIRKARKLLSTYLKAPLQDGRLTCSYNPVGTRTGRTSSSKSILGYGTNMQNLPPEMKNLLLADEGYLLGIMDLSNAENRIVANVANIPSQIEAFARGEDVHRLTASKIFGVPPKLINKEQRQTGKAANHGLNYGLGVDKFCLINNLKRREGKAIYDGYFKAYPEIKQWHRYIDSQIYNTRSLTNCLGRKRIFIDFINQDLLNEAYDFIPQSTVADILHYYGIRRIYEDLPDVQLLNDVHDAVWFQIPEDHIDLLPDIRNMLEVPLTWEDRTWTIPIDCHIGPSMDKLAEYSL